MKTSDLLRRLGGLGFPLLEPEQDANLTLADVVKSKDPRLWEGFPVVLANSSEKQAFDYKTVKRYLEKTADKSCFDSLVALSLALYKSAGLKFTWTYKLYDSLPNNGKKEYGRLVKVLKNDGYFMAGAYRMSVQGLKSVFNNYFKQSGRQLSDLLSEREEAGLEYSLSQVFSPKQKELLFKKLRREKLTKTEKEYFSRAVKKKVLALANTELHRLAKKLIEN